MLLVEDDVESAKTIQVMLRRRGLSVWHVSSGEEAVSVFGADEFDVVVSDIQLGGMSGVEVLRAIRQNHPDFPVILLTAHDTLQTAIDAVRFGAQNYILKPLTNIESLLAPVKKAVENSRLVAENTALRDRLQLLASEIMVAEEKERRNLAGDLHDTVGQSLMAVKMKMDAMLAAEPQDERVDQLREVKVILDEVVQQVRTLIFNLSPPILHALGLDAALDSLVIRSRVPEGPQITYAKETETVWVEHDMSVILFRSVRELLKNAIKYAKARNIVVTLSVKGNLLQLVVEDDGVGFNVESVLAYSSERFGYGLFSIRERLKNQGGTMLISSQEGVGSRITLTVPVKHE
jgi:signal transduction histidine kinase